MGDKSITMHRVRSMEEFEKWIENTADDHQRAAIDVLGDAISEVMKINMKGALIAVSFCTMDDFFGHKPVHHIHNTGSAVKLAEFYEHCAKRIRDREKENNGR